MRINITQLNNRKSVIVHQTTNDNGDEIVDINFTQPRVAVFTETREMLLQNGMQIAMAEMLASQLSMDVHNIQIIDLINETSAG